MDLDDIIFFRQTQTHNYQKPRNKGKNYAHKSGLVVSKLDSQSKGCGFKSGLIQIQDRNGLRAMPGSIPAPNSDSFMEK